MKREVKITNMMGINAGNAPKLVQIANNYKSSIWIETDDRRVNAKSLLGVISLGVKKDMVVTVIAEGADEAEATDKIIDIIENGFEK